MISESLSYLRESDEWTKTTLIGGVLLFFSFLLFPLVFVYGYTMRVLRNTMRDDDTVPVFDDWGEMGVDGLKAAVIVFAYGIIPSLVFVAIMFVGGGLGALTGSDAGAAAGFLVVLAGGLVAFVLGLLAAYIIPAALMNYAEKGTVGAGFDIGSIRTVATNRKYFNGWLYAFVIGLGVTVVFGVINVVPLLGQLVTFVLGPFVYFYASVAVAYIFGHTWAEMHPVEVRHEATPDEQAAI